MPNSSAIKKTRLLNPWALGVVATAVGGLLWMTFQQESVFRPDERQPDEVSANYAELLLTAHPQDDALRIKLLDLLMTLGDYPRARKHLSQWPHPNTTVAQLYALHLDALDLPQGGDQAARTALVERLSLLDRRQLPVPALERMADLLLVLQARRWRASVMPSWPVATLSNALSGSALLRSGRWQASNLGGRRTCTCNWQRPAARPSSISATCAKPLMP